MKEPIFYWDEDSGIAQCELEENGKKFVGIAKCAKDDQDMKSHLTGEEIALHRAQIKYYTHIRDNEIIPQLNILKQFYYSINLSSKYNKNSYENKKLLKLIEAKKDELEIIRNMIYITKKDLHEYLEAKEKLFKLMRRNRKEDALEVKAKQQN